MGIKLRGWRNLAEHYSRDMSTVREWDCPHAMDGKVHVFDTDDVGAWLASRSGNFTGDDKVLLEGASIEDRERLLKARIRKLDLESDKLEFEKLERAKTHAPIADFEAGTVRLLTMLRSHMNEMFDDLMDMSEITPSQKEQLKAKLIDGYNDIANMQFDLEDQAA